MHESVQRSLKAMCTLVVAGALTLCGTMVATADEGDSVAHALERAPANDQVVSDPGESSYVNLGDSGIAISSENSDSGPSRIAIDLDEGGTLSLSEAFSATQENAGSAIEVEAQTLADSSMRLLAVFPEPSSNRSATFDMKVPEGFVASKRGDGGIDIVANAELRAGLEANGLKGDFIIASIDAPWAVDAIGRDVATAFELDGNLLTQTVSPGSNAQFPIVADPRVVWKGFYASLYYTKAETRGMRDQGVIIAGMFAAAAAIAAIPGGAPVAAAMAVIGAAAVGNIAATAANAVSDGRCLKVDVPSMYPAIVRC